LAFFAVAALVGGIFMLFTGKQSTRLEDRLDLFTGAAPNAAKEAIMKENSVLARPLDDMPNAVAKFLQQFFNFDKLFQQADSSMTAGKFAMTSIVIGVTGAALAVVLHFPVALVPVLGIFTSSLPLFWLTYKRSSRLKKFGAQLPDALEMLARALRAGQSLGFGFQAVASELPDPIGKEFGRVFEEQNLGVSTEDSLRAMCERVPNLDLRFFVTAVILQRQTGGDLSEILDKIGELIRERYQILGQVQALTGEGRLSGVVLMGLPIVLFLAVYRINPEYLNALFTDSLGKRMLAGSIVMQILGAIVIRKIVNIEV
jgi:tight adherence protein B